MMMPQEIARMLPEGGVPEDIGCSGAQVLMYPDRVLKIEKDCNMSANEHRMLRWLQGRLPVPEIIAEASVDSTRYLLMTRMPGRYLCDEALLDDQALLAELMAEGFRRMWSVDISDCPTDRSLQQKLKEIEAGLRAGSVTREQSCQQETYGSGGFASPSDLFDWLVAHQPREELAFSHGDYCLPNIFAAGNRLAGFIDLGLSGIADKWLDVEKGLWSMWANTTGVFGGRARAFDRRLLFDALGMQPDEERLRYYSLLDEMT